MKKNSHDQIVEFLLSVSKSRREGYMIIQRSLLQKGLPKETNSLCPECKKVIPATIYKKDGKVMMKKTCERLDIDMYLKAEQRAYARKGN